MEGYFFFFVGLCVREVAFLMSQRSLGTVDWLFGIYHIDFSLSAWKCVLITSHEGEEGVLANGFFFSQMDKKIEIVII